MKFSEFVKKCKTGYPASIPMIVAHIQKYLFDNPITSEETIDEKIDTKINTALSGIVETVTDDVIDYIEENPQIIPQPEVMTGATSLADGAAGIVPKPLAGDNDKALFGDGTFKAIDTVSVMTGATASSDGASGLVPQPLQGDQGKALYGDGTFKTVPYPSAMTGASASADGASGLVPQPLQGDQGKALYGDGTFKTVPYPSAMTGASASADGASGLVPKPLQGDQNKVLFGDGTFKALLDMFYPVGSLYFTSSEFSPATLFGGTWKKLEHAFIYGAASGDTINDTIAGEATHTLTVEEMPSHRHSPTNGGSFLSIGCTSGTEISHGFASGAAWQNMNKGRSSIGYTGNGDPHNNMPPYLFRNIWERTA